MNRLYIDYRHFDAVNLLSVFKISFSAELIFFPLSPRRKISLLVSNLDSDWVIPLLNIVTFQFKLLKLEMTLPKRLRSLLGRTETLLQFLRGLLEPSGMYIFDFDDPGYLRNILRWSGCIDQHSLYLLPLKIPARCSVERWDAGLLNSYSFTKKIPFQYRSRSSMLISQHPLVNLLLSWKGLPTPNCHQATKIVLASRFRGMICRFGM